MTVQFNLLPSVKVEYLKAQRQKHLVILLSTVLSIAAVSVFILLLSIVYGVQKKSLSDLNTKINSESSELTSTQGLNQILTIQNQLKSLPTLDSSKAVSSRLYGYLSQITPAAASISGVNADFTQNTMTISGNADSFTTINTFADTLKFATYTIKGQSGQTKAFSNVLLSGFTSNGTSATYSLSFSFNPVLFDANQTVTLVVPNIITTRSEIDQPTALFQPSEGSH
jgi:Tfp pilus assembly protein PilN